MPSPPSASSMFGFITIDEAKSAKSSSANDDPDAEEDVMASSRR